MLFELFQDYYEHLLKEIKKYFSSKISKGEYIDLTILLITEELDNKYQAKLIPTYISADRFTKIEEFKFIIEFDKKTVDFIEIPKGLEFIKEKYLNKAGNFYKNCMNGIVFISKSLTYYEKE